MTPQKKNYEWLLGVGSIGLMVLIVAAIIGYFILDGKNNQLADTVITKHKDRLAGLQIMVKSECAEITPGLVNLLNEINGENHASYSANSLDECRQKVRNLLKEQPDFLYQSRLSIRKMAIEEFKEELSKKGFFHSAANWITCTRALFANRFSTGSATCPERKVSEAFKNN